MRIVIPSIAGLTLPAAWIRGCEQGRFGEGTAEDFQAFLAAAHPGEPVVDEGDPESSRPSTTRHDVPSTDAGMPAS